MEIKLSVIIPCYNHGQYLPDALASVDKSVYRNQIEIIIINDGSTDVLTKKVIYQLDTEKYVIINQENQGLAKSRNNGILKAKAEYVLMLDADNYIEQVFINDFFEFDKNKFSFDALYGNALHFGEENFIRKQLEYNLYRLTKGNYIDACAIFKRSLLIKIGLYDSKMPYMGLEDWDLWIRVGLINSKIIYINKTYFNYRVVYNSMIRSISNNSHNLTIKYFNKKYCLNKFAKNILEDYINNQIRFKTIFSLFLKKIKLRRNYIFIYRG